MDKNKKNKPKETVAKPSSSAKLTKNVTTTQKSKKDDIRKPTLKTKQAEIPNQLNLKKQDKNTKEVIQDPLPTPTKKVATKKAKKDELSNGNDSKPLPPLEEAPNYGDNQVELDFGNEVYDEADIASALEMGFIAQALEAHKSKVAKETHPDFDGESCIDCGEEIPQLRLDMGRIRCVHCQGALERKNKLHGR